MSDQQPAPANSMALVPANPGPVAEGNDPQLSSPSAALTDMVPAGAEAGLLRDVAHVMAKACLSTIPLAALAFDIGDKLVAFASKKQMTDFLRLLAGQVEYLKQSVSDLEGRLTHSTLYRTTAEHAMVLIAAGEEDAAFLEALRNAALNLGMDDPKALVAQEVARAVRTLTPLQLRMLSIYDRYWNGKLTSEEEEVIAAAPDIEGAADAFRLGALATHSIAYPYLSRTMHQLRDGELLEPGIDGGVMADGTEGHLYLDAVELTPLGQAVLRAVAPPSNGTP
ncbi:hypothetical protein [Azospirillum sp. B2RO_4]|uniref:hypothetical protein n=1 Tax=Azospirillum sp. B2RO_4 TaxID=3027796 RepID=UPI003DAA23D2